MALLAQLAHEQPLMHKIYFCLSPVELTKDLHLLRLAANWQVEHNNAGFDTVTN